MKQGAICVKVFFGGCTLFVQTLVHIVVAKKKFFRQEHLGDTFFSTKNVHFLGAQVRFSVQLLFHFVGARSNFFEAKKYARNCLTHFFASKICET